MMEWPVLSYPLFALSFYSLFQLEPAARALFNFTDAEDVKANANFERHATAMVDMVDCAVSFLGPVSCSISSVIETDESFALLIVTFLSLFDRTSSRWWRT